MNNDLTCVTPVYAPICTRYTAVDWHPEYMGSQHQLHFILGSARTFCSRVSRELVLQGLTEI